MKRISVLFLVVVLLVFGAFSFWINGQQAVNSQDKSLKVFVIEKGASIREIGNKLKEENLIRDPVVFFMYIKLNKQDRNIQAGDYRLSQSMTLSEVIDNLNHGIVDVWVTFPEGIRADEVADLLEESIPSYTDEWRSVLNENEGYLFPDTYLIPKDATVEMVVSMMRNNFENKVSEAGLDPSNIANAVILGSLIEREAITDEEKPLISGIYKNRLDIGMALQVDATVQYAKGYDSARSSWWPQVTVADYRGVSSPYNTYLSPGLPPGPISNPGIEAIKAAANPQDNSYLYYIHASGKIYPARTVEEHNANVRKYL